MLKVSQYGDICERLGHIARDCPLKGKCLWCHQAGHLARECVNPHADSSDLPDDRSAETPSVASPSEMAQPTPPADSYNVSNDSPTSVSSPVLFDSADVVIAMEDVSPAGFPMATMISRIHLALILSLISIKVMLIKNVMLKKVMLILSKVGEFLNKVIMWNIVGVMYK